MLSIQYEKQLWIYRVAAIFPEHFQCFTVAFVWNEFKLCVSAKSRSKTEDLIQKIKELMVSLIKNTVAKAYKSLKSRIITADGIFYN